jgi:ParB-like chromosome segregation protein Spo0J
MGRNLKLFEERETIAELASRLAKAIAALPLAERVTALNDARATLHEVSPFFSEPVDLVIWVPADKVGANDYNPNTVAPPEMKLLRLSILADGYTQPIVACPDGDGEEVVDGFHRHRVGREVPDVRKRVHGYLPIVRIAEGRADKSDRIAATIRHNRARGKHGVQPMSAIVAELRERGWSDEKIATELGMDAEEVLRLKQITGLAALFKDREYSKAWEPA